MTRGEIANLYFESLPYPPYPVQEEAMLAWFTADQGYSSAHLRGQEKPDCTGGPF